MLSDKRVVLIGATGMIGGLALRECLDDPAVAQVTVIGRRTVGLEHPKLVEILHEDYLDYGPASHALLGQDLALFCLGAYTGAVPDDEFRRITVDFTLAFARALHRASPQAAFCLLSGQGADQSLRSRVAFARYKGEAELGLLAQGFSRVHLFRPGYIYPVTPRREPNLMYRTFRLLYPLLRRLYPNIGIASDGLARAMVRVGLDGDAGHGDPVLENRDIRALVTP